MTAKCRSIKGTDDKQRAEFYETLVRQLPPAERLRLAALILDELTQDDIRLVDQSDSWNEIDLRELEAEAFREAGIPYPEV